jgi:hypothetical protein
MTTFSDNLKPNKVEIADPKVFKFFLFCLILRLPHFAHLDFKIIISKMMVVNNRCPFQRTSFNPGLC